VAVFFFGGKRRFRMKGTVSLQLNDDDTITMQATVPIDADRAKPYHFGFDFEDMGGCLAKAGEMLGKIKTAYIDPTAKNVKLLS
jgi:hypothetical protein